MAAVLMQPIIKSTIMTVAAVAARLTVLCRDCLSVATRGTETCAVPTVRDDGIELVMLVKPGFEGQVSAGSCTRAPATRIGISTAKEEFLCTASPAVLTSTFVAIGEARVDIHATVGVVFIAEASLAHLCSVQAVCIFDSQSLCQVSQYCAGEIVQPLVNAVGQVVEYSTETWYPIDDAA